MIREAQKDDLKGILELYKYLFPEENYDAIDKYKNIWNQIINNSNLFKYFIAIYENKIVSTCCNSIIPNLTRNTRPYSIIENVITHPDYRKQGFGKKVMLEAINYAKNQNCYKVMLLSSSYRKDAHKFYKNLGFDDKSKSGFQIRFS